MIGRKVNWNTLTNKIMGLRITSDSTYTNAPIKIDLSHTDFYLNVFGFFLENATKQVPHVNMQ